MDIKLRRKETKVYDLVALSADLGFTPVKVSNRYYSLEEHDSVMIDTIRNTFKQYSTNAFGDAVAFCMSLGLEANEKFKSLSYALKYVEERIKDNPESKVDVQNIKHNVVKKDLNMPQAARDNKRVYRYMDQRCIDEEVVNEFIRNKWLYQEKQHNNLVFVSYKDDQPAFITEKGIIQELRFMKEYPGNDYDHCFFIDYKSDTLVVTEAIVDMMSFMTLDVDHYKESSYLSINSTTKDNAIYKQLEAHPEITKVKLRLDHDEAGINATTRIQNNLKELFPSVEVDIDYPPSEKDWNDYLVYDVNGKEKLDEFSIIF